jgi:hypothetical protein
MAVSVLAVRAGRTMAIAAGATEFTLFLVLDVFVLVAGAGRAMTIR